MASTTQEQRDAWNKFSGGWKKWDDFTMHILEPVGSRLIEELDLQSTDAVLDVSTGTGEPGLTAATKAARVTATDVAEEMIEIARQKAANRKLTNFDVIVADAESLPFEDSSFDAIICRFGVMFFGNPQAGLNEMVRLLKPSGKLALSAWTEPTKNPWATTASSVINGLLDITPPAAEGPGLFRQSAAGTLTEMLTSAGLTGVNQTEISGEWVFDSPEQYWEFVTDVVAPVAIPLSTASFAIREKAKEAVLKVVSDFIVDGKVVFGWSSWIATGSKP